MKPSLVNLVCVCARHVKLIAEVVPGSGLAASEALTNFGSDVHMLNEAILILGNRDSTYNIQFEIDIR